MTWRAWAYISFFTIIAFSIATYLYYTYKVRAYEISKETDAWIEVAKKNNDPAEIAKALGKYKDGLKNLGLDSGHYALIFKSEGNSLSQLVAQVDRLEKGFNALTDIDSGSEAYFKGFEINRGVLLALPSNLGANISNCEHGLVKIIIFHVLSWSSFIVIVILLARCFFSFMDYLTE